jgi:hypothetical protein
MAPLLKVLALALAGAFAFATFEAPAEAREPAAKKRQVRQAPRHRVAQRPAPPARVAPVDPRMPFSGPGRAQFEPVVTGAQPDRAEGRNPEGP